MIKKNCILFIAFSFVSFFYSNIASAKSIGAYCSSLPAVSCEILDTMVTSHQDGNGYLQIIVTYCKNREIKTAMKFTAWNCASTGWCGSANGSPTGWVLPLTHSCSALP